MKTSHLSHKSSMPVSLCFGGHFNLNQGQRTRLLYLQPNIGSHWGLRRSEFTVPLGTFLLHSLSSLSSSHAAQIRLQSHSLTQPLKAVLWCCLLLQLCFFHRPVCWKRGNAESLSAGCKWRASISERHLLCSDTQHRAVQVPCYHSAGKASSSALHEDGIFCKIWISSIVKLV